MSVLRGLRRWARRRRDLLPRLGRHAVGRLLGGLPVAWLGSLARLHAVVRLVFRSTRRTGRENLALALGFRPGREPWRLLREATALHGQARLQSVHPRDPTRARLRAELCSTPWSRERPLPLLLISRLGAAAFAQAIARSHGLWADLDRLPRRGEDAAWIPWLGRLTAVDLHPFREALTERRQVRLLLVLPDTGSWKAWWSPDLSPAGPPEAVAERALRVLETLVRAAPHLWDWTWPRWRLRPEREAEGHAPSSRLAPWLNPRRRTGRRGRRAR